MDNNSIFKDLFLAAKSEPIPGEIECKGLVFRANRSQYFTGSTLASRTELRLLKRKSCPGCEKCGWLWDELRQSDFNNRLDFDAVSHGKCYTIDMCNVSTDWESGVIDDYDLEFIEVKETLN
jgi:hypothetical protein